MRGVRIGWSDGWPWGISRGWCWADWPWRWAGGVGIHVILATQRPDAKVISGGLKANMTGRIAFKMATSQNSRTILEESVAEDLLGRGDMLFRGKGGQIKRVQGAIIPDADIAALVAKVAKKCEKHEPGVVMPECLSNRSS